MRIFEVKPRYSEETGEQIGFRSAVKEYRCDFSGEVMYDDLYEDEPFVTYTIDYGGNDPFWGGMGAEGELRDEFEIWGSHQLMQDDPFAIMIKHEDAFKQAFVESTVTPFADFLRVCRSKTALKLLQEGVIEAKQLDGYEGPEEIY